MNIGKLEQVANLRAIWETESRFSDWLVSEEGLEVVARDLEIQVENARREVRPGDYPCDIVGHVLGDENHVVIIENQFGRTNHDHLGKLMTYAAVNHATTAVWVAEEVSDDHRSAIDWLNSNTPPQINFFLVLIRAFRIGDSPIAPKLEVICQPNVQAKVKRTLDASQLNQSQDNYRQLWTQIHTFLVEKKFPFPLRKPSTGHWSTIKLASTYEVNLLALKNAVGIEFVANPPEREVVFERLLERKNAIEESIGTELNWECKPDLKRFRVFLYQKISPWNVESQKASFEWLDLNARAFVPVFKSEVALLKATSFPAFSPLSDPSRDSEGLE